MNHPDNDNRDIRELRKHTQALADMYVKASKDPMTGLAAMGEDLMQYADTIEGASWSGLIHELRRLSG